MAYIVETGPQALQALSRCSPAQQFFFRQIVSILEESPRAFRELIHEGLDARGRPFFQYYDGVVPLVFLYGVYDSDADATSGYVYIFRAEPAWY